MLSTENDKIQGQMMTFMISIDNERVLFIRIY